MPIQQATGRLRMVDLRSVAAVLFCLLKSAGGALALLRSPVCAVFIAGALGGAVPALAFPLDQCAADRYGSDLNCTANDVSITGMRVIGDTLSCIGGTDVTLNLEMTVNFSTPDRWDVGIFVSRDGKSPQTTATSGGAAACTVSVLPTASPFLDLDGTVGGVSTGDACGDGNGTIGGGTGSGIHYMPNVTVPCQSLGGAGGNLYIPFVVSWDNQKSPSGALCRSNADPVPNTSSKCNSPTVIQGTVGVRVLPSITKTDGRETLHSGDSTTYTVIVTNTTGVALANVLFKDPAVTGITVDSVACAAAGGASCPAGSSAALKAAMQGSGLTLPSMPAGSSVTFTMPATLVGSPTEKLTNTATVTVVGQTNSASDTNTIVGTIFLDPPTQAKTGDKGAVVSYTYTLYNFGSFMDVITLSATSNKGWFVMRSPITAIVPAGGSTTVTVTVFIPSGASIGTVDTTTLTAVSGLIPSKTATAKAVTTITNVLTLTPSNTGSGGAGSYVYYSHRVQSNAATSKTVSLTPTFAAGSCAGWTSALYEADKTTALTSPIYLAANGGYKDFVLRVKLPSNAANGSACTASLAAAYTSGAASTVTVTDVTTVKNLLLFEDPGYVIEQDTFPVGNDVYAKAFGLTNGTPYYYVWLDPSGTVMRTSPVISNLVSLPDTYTLPTTGPLGTWEVQLWNASANTIFVSTNFYVGPDHVKAAYSGTNPPVNADSTVVLALHDKLNHAVPIDADGNLVRGSPTDTEGPLMITVTLSGSAEIVSTTLANAVISGQSVTGRLSSTTGTATLTIRDSVAETITVTPASYKSVLYGSPVRDEPATITFAGSAVHHYELSLPAAGISCLPSVVTVTACSDSSSPCTAPASNVNGETATLAASAGTLSSTTVAFNAGGTASATLQYPAAINGAQATVTLSAEQTAATNPRQCCPDGANCAATDRCSIIFSTAGLIFSATANGSEATVGNQTAGVAFGPYWLRAVKTGTETKACEAALTGTRAVNFEYQCIDPASCATGNWLTIDGTAIGSGGTAVSLAFDADGNASLGSMSFGDVGRIGVTASATTGGATLSGSMKGAGGANFVVKPYGFALTNIRCSTVDAANCAPGALAMAPPAVPGDNPAAADAAGASFIHAGNSFSATISAINQSGANTPSFGRETAAEGVVLARNLVASGGGAAGILAGTVAIPGASFQAGVKGSATVADLTWSEVGIITLTAAVADGNYLGAGNAASTSGNVGRFIPYRFAVTSGSPSQGCGAFTYFGQEFRTPFNVTAQRASCTETCTDLTSSVCVCTTTNYSGTSWAKLDLNAWTGTASATGLRFSATGLPGASTLEAGAGAPTGAWIDGVATFTLLPAHRASRPGAAPVPPSTIIMLAQPQDADGVSTAAPATVASAAVPLRFGMLKLDNASGSERQDLPVGVAAMYYAGSPIGWAVNALDGCTSLPSPPLAPHATNTTADACYSANCTGNAGGTAGSLWLHDIGGTRIAQAAVPSGTNGLLAGRGTVTLTRPLTAGTLELTLTAPAWLQANSGRNGTAGSYDWNPVGRITFGVYGPPTNKSRFIYRRESY